MDTIRSKLDTADPAFQENVAHMRAFLATWKKRVEQVKQGGRPAATETHVKRGKLPVRERIERLLDPDTPFLEFSSRAALVRKRPGRDRPGGA